MTVELQGITKRFGTQWLFKDLNYQFTSPGCWAITGPNGAGKTTLLKIIAGMMPPTEGNVHYSHNGQSIDLDNIYRYMAFAGPYMELLEELTLGEMLRFHFTLKSCHAELSNADLAARLGLSNQLDLPISKFSSGMKQRIRLGLGTFTDVPVLLLDEPTSNLDEQGAEWYRDHLQGLIDHKLVIICSNNPKEYQFCHQCLDLTELS